MQGPPKVTPSQVRVQLNNRNRSCHRSLHRQNFESSRSIEQTERRLRLRFVAAVSASCSGDKSDKEESAGCFSAMGIVRYGCNV